MQRPAESTAHEFNDCQIPQSAQTSPLLRPGVRHLVLADTSWVDEGGLASVCRICGGYLRCHSDCISTLDGFAAGGIGCGVNSHSRSRKGLCRVCQPSVLLVVVAFLVANAVVKSGLGRRISLLVVSIFGRSTLGLGYSIFCTDAMNRTGVSEQYSAWRRSLPHRTLRLPRVPGPCRTMRRTAGWEAT